MSLGVYVLGAADDEERRRVEAHLPTCPACRGELTRLAPLNGLLAAVPAELMGDGRAPSPATPRLRPARERSRSGGAWRIVVAACLAAIAGAVAGFSLAPAPAGPRPATVTIAGSNPALHMSATAALTATSWGTLIELRLSGLPLNVPCRLIVRSRAGASEVSGVWAAWRKGPISVPASADWRLADIASLQIVTATRDLVTIDARNTH
jgi:hypothetical protein